MSEAVNRINQYDALMIDQECKSMLFTQLLKVFDYFPQKFKIQYEDELRLFLEFLFYKMTIGSSYKRKDASGNINVTSNQTPGNLLQNLEFGLDALHPLTSTQKILYVLLKILLPYLMKKFQVTKKYKIVAKAIKIIKFVNFIYFMVSFKYRNIIERILKIDLYTKNPELKRNLDFTYINRVIVWNALGKSMTSFLPFLDFSKIMSFFASTASIATYAHVDSSDLNNI